jgi:type VII secretion integral membrane protein EccD
VLHLVPGTVDWPELEYDDLVDAVAAGAGRGGRLWGARHSRLAGLGIAVVCVLLALVAVLRSGPPWPLPAATALAVAAAALVAGTLIARATADAGTGALIAALALPAALLGGALLFGGNRPLSGLGAEHLLVGCVLLVVAAVLGRLGAVDLPALFAAAATAGILGAATAAAVTLGWSGAGPAAAVLACAVFLLSPLTGGLAARLGRVPLPVLPRTGADLVRDDPLPPRLSVYAAVLRADALLTGMLAGGVAVVCVAHVRLAAGASGWTLVLLALLSAGFAVRARLYPALRHRAPLLVAGVLGAVSLAAGPLMADPDRLVGRAVPLLLVAATLAVAAACAYSRRAPGVALGRYAELLETVLVLACVPVLCAVLGLYALVRGLGG